MAERKTGECSCKKNKKGRAKSKPSKRKRQTMVYNPDEEVWHEPYLNCLRKEFSQISIPCDSKIELPWKDIAIPAVAMKIRANVAVKDTVTVAGDETASNDLAKQFGEKTAESKESTGKFNLPWNDLLVMDTVVPQPTLRADGAICDSTLEIPWNDLALERPIEIRPIPDEEPCNDQDVEIPWEEILIPANIIIETKKIKKHPSSKVPPTHFSDHRASFMCCGKSCHVKTGRKSSESAVRQIMESHDTSDSGRYDGSNTCNSKAFVALDNLLGQHLHPQSSDFSSVTLTENNPSTIATIDSEGDSYETSSEGPHSPHNADSRQSATTFVVSFGTSTLPESNKSQVVGSSLSSGGEFRVQESHDPHASYTIIGTADSSPRIADQTSRAVGTSYLGIQIPSNGGVVELETRRTEYTITPRVEIDTNKSESLPIIKISTPWGSHEYPDVHLPAERLVSDSPVDMKEKMRLIAACMDGDDPQIPKTRFAEESEIRQSILHQIETQEYVKEPRDAAVLTDQIYGEISGAYSQVTTPRTSKFMSGTSLKNFTEIFNVLPIMKNPNFGSDYTFHPSPSGSSMLPASSMLQNNEFPNFLRHRDSELLRQQRVNPNNKSYDPLSRIEGELGPLQNELSEIRGKVRALNLDYNLSCIEGMSRLPKTMNWISPDHPQVRPVKDDFISHDFFPTDYRQNEKSLFKGSDDYSSYRCPFINASSVTPDPYVASYNLENQMRSNLVTEKVDAVAVTASHPKYDLAVLNSAPVEICNLKNDVPEVPCSAISSKGSADRNLSHALHICTSTPSRENPHDIEGSVPDPGSKKNHIDKEAGKWAELFSEEEIDSLYDEKPTSPEIKLPDISEKICIVPIAYPEGMPAPPAEPVFKFAHPEELKSVFGGVGHLEVLRIEHPDAPRRRDVEYAVNVDMSSSSSETAFTLPPAVQRFACPRSRDSDTEIFVSSRKDLDRAGLLGDSMSPSGRKVFNKFGDRDSCAPHISSTKQSVSGEKPYIRGLVCGPEDFL